MRLELDIDDLPWGAGSTCCLGLSGTGERANGPCGGSTQFVSSREIRPCSRGAPDTLSEISSSSNVHLTDRGSLDAKADRIPLPPTSSIPSASSPISAISEFDEFAYMTFAEGSRAENGGQTLALLPDGAYWLVRRPLLSLRSNILQLGNDLTSLPPMQTSCARSRRPLCGRLRV